MKATLFIIENDKDHAQAKGLIDYKSIIHRQIKKECPGEDSGTASSPTAQRCL